MKIDDIDFRFLDKLVAAGATAQVIVEVLKEGKQAEKRERERERLQAKRGNNEQQAPTSSNIEQHPPTPQEKPSQTAERELFNLGKRVLGKTCGGLVTALVKWHRYDLAAARAVIETAAHKSDPREYVVAHMRTGNGTGNSVMAAADRLIARAESHELAQDDREPDLAF